MIKLELTEKQYNILIIIGVIILIVLSVLVIIKSNNYKLVDTPYVCWNIIPSSYFRAYSIEPLQYNNIQVSFQQNFIFVNKNESTIYWYQFIFAVNNHNNTKNNTYIGLEKWKAVNGSIIEDKLIVYKKVNLYIGHFKPYYNISNNIATVYFTSYNKTGYQIYKISENIPEGFNLANPLQNESIFYKIGFYSSNFADYEIDFNNTGIYDTLKQVLYCEKFKVK